NCGVENLHFKNGCSAYLARKKAIFINALKAVPKGPVIVVYGVENEETLDFAHDVRDLLNDAGYSMGPKGFIHSWGMRFNPPHPEISLAICTFKDVPPPEYAIIPSSL